MDTQTMSGRPDTADSLEDRSRRGRWPAGVVRAVGAGLLMMAAVAGQAQERPGPGTGMEPGPGPGRGHGMRHGPGGPQDPGMMMFGGSPEHVARRVDRLLDGVNATDAQRAQVRQIATAASADLRGQRDAERGLRERALQIFTAPTVDATAAEALRQQSGVQRDQASRRVLQAMLDIARVLTPEQRATLGQRLRDRETVMRERAQRPSWAPGARMPAPPAPPSAPPR